MTTSASVEKFLSHKNVAVAGVSRNGKKFGNTILKDLIAKGYAVSVVHPEAEVIEGYECYPSLSELPAEVEALVLVVPPSESEKLVRDASAAGIRSVWMQQGSNSDEAVRLCHEAGIEEVHGECILMFAQPTGIHKFHHWLWGLIGKLPQEHD
ncbi:MAG: CoA-binding protein [bacterium]|nr:CoA-binding protein [bacterium]